MIVLRPAQAEDAEAVARLHTVSWRDAYAEILDPDYLSGPIEDERLATWRGRLSAPPPGQIVLLAEDAGTAVGFVCAVLDDDATWGSRIDNLHVSPDHRGAGLGERLLLQAARDVAAARPGSSLYLWVFEANLAGRRFYRRLGGVEVERDASLIPSAAGKPVLRVHWPRVEALAQP